ncbi:hypothetical protein BBJ28_00002773 [Nothophytophthora sp. Chile5]|nr:hypothetical protein BBJ28_00002773 [Nothophytophthora sp. Chile5]
MSREDPVDAAHAAHAAHAAPVVLVTIPASNYVEKARWALRFAGVPFIEEKWAPLFVYLSTMPKGGKSVPLLVLPSPSKVALTDSTDIMAFCARTMPELYANEDAKRLETLYDSKLGPHARRCGTTSLSHDVLLESLVLIELLSNAEAAKKILVGPIEGFVQYYLAWLCFPVLKALLLRALNVNEQSAERSWAKLEQLLGEAEQRLGDGPVGSHFLAGNSFSAADISLCAHLSLLLFPPEHEYIGPYMSVDQIQSPVFRDRLEKLRRSKIGQYVLWCYQNKRPATAIKARL